MPETPKISVNFTVRKAYAGQPNQAYMGNQLRWAVMAKYNYMDMSSIATMRVQKKVGDDFQTLINLGMGTQFYVDNTGSEVDIYRLIPVDTQGVEGLPSLEKTPQMPESVVVWGRICKVSGQPVENATIYFTIQRPPKCLDSITLASTEPVSVNTGQDGYFEVLLVPNVVIAINSRTLGIVDKEVIIPAGRDFYNITEVL
jgi:hypothetical protein